VNSSRPLNRVPDADWAALTDGEIAERYGGTARLVWVFRRSRNKPQHRRHGSLAPTFFLAGWPARSSTVNRALAELAESDPTPEQYEQRKARILKEAA
jgi:hypothetical protein